METINTESQSSHAKAIQDREAIRRASKKINENRSTARAFLERAGIITPTGKLRKSYQ